MSMLACLARLLMRLLLLLESAVWVLGCTTSQPLSCSPWLLHQPWNQKICLPRPALQINDRYEFPEQLDLDYGDRRFLAQEADQSVRNVYKLHSVLVHSGGVHGGHYYAFIRPDGKQWLKFDDDKVSNVQNPALLFSCRTLKATCTCMPGHAEVLPTRAHFAQVPALHCTDLAPSQATNIQL